MNRSASGTVVRIGVIGLGRAWADRYRSALSRPGGRARVVAVCDPVVHRTEAEADRLSCDPVEGLTALADRPDVDAVFLIDDPWFGPWPLRPALERSKPVYSAIGLRSTLDELAEGAADPGDPQGGPPVMIELARRFAPATLRIQELLATELGPPRHVSASIRAATVSEGSTTGGPADSAIELVDWCRSLFRADPIGWRLARRADRALRGLRVVDLDFPEGGSAQLTLAFGPGERRGGPARLSVEADRGRARIDRRGRLRWSAGGPPSEELLPVEATVDLMIERFLLGVAGEEEQSSIPSRADLATLDLLSRVFDV